MDLTILLILIIDSTNILYYAEMIILPFIVISELSSILPYILLDFFLSSVQWLRCLV